MLEAAWLAKVGTILRRLRKPCHVSAGLQSVPAAVVVRFRLRESTAATCLDTQISERQTNKPVDACFYVWMYASM